MKDKLKKEYEVWVEFKARIYNELFNGKITILEYLQQLEKYRYDTKRTR